MSNRNEDIKKVKGSIPYSAIAKKLGIHEVSLYRWMRTEMTEDRKKLVLSAIEESKRDAIDELSKSL